MSALCRGAMRSCHIYHREEEAAVQRGQMQLWGDTEDQLLGECEEVIIFHLQNQGFLMCPSHITLLVMEENHI